MKVFCDDCGCHFEGEFETTLVPECHFWERFGIAHLTSDEKRQIYDTGIFGINTDYYAEKYGLQIGCSLQIHAAPPKSKWFESIVPGWDEKTDAERRDYERKHFKEVIAKDKAKRKLDEEGAFARSWDTFMWIRSSWWRRVFHKVPETVHQYADGLYPILLNILEKRKAEKIAALKKAEQKNE